MYNSGHKTKFISTIMSGTNRQIAEKIFIKTEAAESELNKDLYLFSDDEIRSIISEILPARKEGQTSRIKILFDYFDFSRLVTGLVIPEHDLLKYDSLNEKFAATMVDGPDGLARYLESVFPSGEGNRIDCIYKCYCWLAFMGVNEEDALDIKVSDVELDYLDVLYKGAALPIYREAYMDFRRAVTSTEFVTFHPLYPDKPNIRQRIPGDGLLRGVKAVPNTSTFRSTLTHRGQEAFNSGKTDKKLSYQRIRLSGLYYETFMLERRGVVPDFRSEAETEILRKGKEYNRLNDYIRQSAKRYLDDYYRWKLIFWNN